MGRYIFGLVSMDAVREPSTRPVTQIRPAVALVCGAYQCARLLCYGSTGVVVAFWTYFMTVGREKPEILASSTMLMPFA